MTTDPAEPAVGAVTPLSAASLEAEAAAATLPTAVVLAFAPLHKRAFGMAIGLTSGLVVAAVTVVTLLAGAGRETGLGLLSEYFYGYSVSWSGAAVGFIWAWFTGFVAGWFLAFCRNLALAGIIFVTRTKAELAATRDFLDHI